MPRNRGVVYRPDDTTSALKEIIRIQDEQLQLQKSLITALDTRFGVVAGPTNT